MVIAIFCIPQLIVFGVTLIREFIVKQTRSTTLPHRMMMTQKSELNQAKQEDE